MYIGLHGNDLRELFFVMVFSGPTILLMIRDHSSLHKDIIRVIKTISGFFPIIIDIAVERSGRNMCLLLKGKEVISQ